MKSILVFFFVVSCFTLTKAQEVQLKVNKSLSATDKAAVEKLLKDFDPNTYSFSANYIDQQAKRKKWLQAVPKAWAVSQWQILKLLSLEVLPLQ